MKYGKSSLVIIIAAIICAALAVGFYLSSNLAGDKAPPIVMPSDKQGNLDGDVYDEDHMPGDITRIELNASNVQNVIATIERPEKYACRVDTSVYYNDNIRMMSALCYTAGQYTKTEILGNSDTVATNIISTPDTTYIWSEGSSSYYQGATGGFSSDDVQHIPTSDDILMLDRNDIKSASYTEMNGQNCICAEVYDPEMQYTEKYYVSTDTGLLKYCETLDKTGEKIYSMEMSAESYDFDTEVFKLPDSTLVYTQ